ncbi:MAG: imidazole glycerol phosphate synthase subunit HisH [Desulfotomaculales bacterium]
MIAVVNYGMGNLLSVQKGLECAGFPARVVDATEDVAAARGVVLPGVGAFADAVRNLRAGGLDRAVLEAVAAGKPLLGICLGMQLLFEASEEWGHTAGLGVFKGKVRRLPEGVKVPHMGWNRVFPVAASALFAGIPGGTRFYFVHSYYVAPADGSFVLAETEYGVRFAVAVGDGRVFGVQFHPEKSGRPGLAVLANFGRLVEACT